MQESHHIWAHLSTQVLRARCQAQKSHSKYARVANAIAVNRCWILFTLLLAKPLPSLPMPMLKWRNPRDETFSNKLIINRQQNTFRDSICLGKQESCQLLLFSGCTSRGITQLLSFARIHSVIACCHYAWACAPLFITQRKGQQQPERKNESFHSLTHNLTTKLYWPQ